MTGRTPRRLLITMSIAALVAATIVAATSSVPYRLGTDRTTSKSGSALATFAAKITSRAQAVDPLRTPTVATLLLDASLSALAFAGLVVSVSTTSKILADGHCCARTGSRRFFLTALVAVE